MTANTPTDNDADLKSRPDAAATDRANHATAHPEPASDINADPVEIGKFDQGVEHWWDLEGEFAPLHRINPLRLEWVAKHAGGLDGKRVLDIGCGGGMFAEAMASLGAEVTGIDLATGAIEAARLHALDSGLDIDYREMPAEALASEAPASFDVVTCLELLEHVPDPGSIVTAAATLAKPGAPVYFSTLNRNPKSWLFAIVGAEHVLRILPRGTHDWRKFIKPAELDQHCRAAGLTLDAMTGLHYNPLKDAYHLGPGVDVNYMVATFKR
ncbi:MAG: bifunctional 3-demethylubiquinol 3-O-methyltransferase/2-polyprenyl-6-hydroxyphenol methylase [Gammaproteobacteria bacterium]|nr:MAG: bifunctional 3-demethylubiquinol 3-O-methyltransferase/2-polyprenyl-6-hydroxyphenol methylase [Gammaproteobacteria bacterium]